MIMRFLLVAIDFEFFATDRFFERELRSLRRLLSLSAFANTEQFLQAAFFTHGGCW